MRDYKGDIGLATDGCAPAIYGTVRAFAEQLGLQDAVKVLSQTLDEEYAADRKLTALAEIRVNQ